MAQKNDWQKHKKYIDELSDLLNEKGLSEIQLSTEELNIVLRKEINVNQASFIQSAPSQAIVEQTAQTNAVLSKDNSSVKDVKTLAANILTSPMVGVVYLSPSPDSLPFVSVGSTVKEGDTVMIIEAMKVMNNIVAHKSGSIQEIYVGNEQAVEFGESLLVIV